MENELNLIEDESISVSIYQSSVDDNSDGEYIGKNTIKHIRYGNYVHPNMHTRYSRLKICDHIKQSQSEWKGV